jgi:class 3 adenylate cyclase/tetratricopeptide (TPR) repeat protein
MKCPKCSTDNAETRKFCRECGEKLLIKCPKCESENLPDDKFCGECGCDLSKPTEAPAIDYKEPQSYTPKFLQDKILTNRSAIEGERKLVSVLFADVANYTSISENLDPEEIHHIMDGCFQILMDEIHEYEGTINQFTGDGLMALFGAPVAHEDHSQRACHAALSIQNAIGSYSEKVNKDCGADFQMRIGINSGLVIVGSIGDDLRMDYTAVGDTTNLAARMESMAQPGAIFVSRNTERLARDFFEFKSLGKVEVKGKEDAQEAFELIKAGEVETRIGASVAKGLTRFVGRKNSMAALMEAYERAKSGSGQVVGVVGEAGVGKSRLLLEMRSMLPQGEFSYLEGRCIHFGSSMIYLPILDILRSYFQIEDGDREFIIKKKMQEKILDLDEKLKGVLAPIHDLLSLKVDDEAFDKLEPNEKRERTFEAIRNLLIRQSQEKPLILAVEDLHWIDKTSEEFLGYLIDWLANSPILLILLYRPEYTHQWGSKSYYTRIGVDQLGTPSSTQLVQAILEEGQIAPELEQLILNRAAGNPLFMEEFTRTLLENGSIERKSDQYVLSRNAADTQVPDTIQGIIAARMDRLEDNLKRTMQVASVIGRDFAFSILQTITGMKQELKSHLINLQGLEFIYEKQLFPELEYIFKHILTQEVAYNSLLLKRRKEIHEKIGQAIEEIYADRLEEFYEMLAYHYSKSNNPKKAYTYFRLSGNKSMQKHSPWEALHHYKEAVNSIKELPPCDDTRKDQIEIYRLLHAPFAILGYPEGSLEIFQDALEVSKKIGDAVNLAHFYTDIGFYQGFRGKLSNAIKSGKNAVQEAKKTDDSEAIISTINDLCYIYSWRGEYFKIAQLAPEGIDLAEKTKKEYEIFQGRTVCTYMSLCLIYGFSMGMIGNFSQGKLYCEKANRVAEKINHLRSLGQAEGYCGFLDSVKGDYKHAIEHLQKSVELCEQSKYFLQLIFSRSFLGYAYLLQGDPKIAIENIKIAIKLHNDIGFMANLSWHYIYLSMAYFDLGNLEKALGCIEKSISLSHKCNEKGYEGQAHIWRGRILAKLDPSKKVETEESVRKGIEILKPLQLKPLYADGYLALGEIYADIGQAKQALGYLKDAEMMFDEMGMDYWSVKTRKVLSRV